MLSRLSVILVVMIVSVAAPRPHPRRDSLQEAVCLLRSKFKAGAGFCLVFDLVFSASVVRYRGGGRLTLAAGEGAPASLAAASYPLSPSPSLHAKLTVLINALLTLTFSFGLHFPARHSFPPATPDNCLPVTLE